MAFGLLLALIGLEIGIRTVAPQGLVTEFFRYEETPLGGPGFRLQPGLWIPGAEGGSINRLGLRGPEITQKSGAHRVLVLGDSFVYGAGVSTSHSLPQQLDQLTGDSIEFVNAGTPSYGTVRELAWLETYGEQLAPDEVLLGVFIGNDFTDNLEVASPQIVDGRLFSGAAADDSAAVKNARVWLNSLHLYRLLQRRSYGEPRSAGIWSESDSMAKSDKQEAALEILKTRFAGRQMGRLAVYVPARGLDPRMDLAYDMTRLGLEGIFAWCREREVVLRLVLIPDVLQVEPDMLRRALSQAEEPAVPADYERPQRELMAWCETLGIPCLDLRAGMQAETMRRSHSLYLFGDSHWNAEGHLWAAEQIQRGYYLDFTQE